MNKKFPFAFFGVLLAVTLILAAVIYFPGKKSVPRVQNSNAVALTASYIISVREISDEYLASETQAAGRVAESKLLSLTVPSEYRDFHLDAVLALHRYGIAKARDIVSLKENVKAVFDSALWLK
ncbi:MAG: hypothetical protein WCJ29_03225 [bacterium]